MTQRFHKEHIVRYKLLYTMVILFVYLIGRNIPLYGVDITAYEGMGTNVANMLTQAIGGDLYQHSVFALGISPYITASILVQIASLLRKTASTTRISQYGTNRATLALTSVIAVVQGFLMSEKLVLLPSAESGLTRLIIVLEMIVGVAMMIWLSERNKRYGIGGQTALIYVNIMDGLLSTMSGHTLREMGLPLAISALALLVTIHLENTELRIPVQRISIHNIYEDKDYIAIKLNPIGVMPIMFSTAIFSLPQMLVQMLVKCFPNWTEMQWLEEHLVLTEWFGSAIYIGILYLLTIVFAMVFINPGDLAEQMLKSGDSIINLHAGRQTGRYLRRCVLNVSAFSASVLCLSLGIPMVLRVQGILSETLATLPTSIMMLGGIWCNLYQEFLAVRSMNSYRPFL